MSKISSIVSEECQRCGGVNIIFADIEKKQYDAICKRCGKSRLSRNSTDERGKPIRINTSNEGYGVVYIETPDSKEYTYFSEADDKDVVEDFLKKMKSKNVRKEKSYISYWDKETKALKVIYGKIPETFNQKWT